MKHTAVLTLGAIALGAIMLSSPAHAGTITIAGDSNAAQGNFQSPGSTANVGYTIETSDDGVNFNVVLNSTDPHALSFANLYFDTIASTPGTGSNLGFEFGATSEDAFDPSTSTKYSIAGSGVKATFTEDSNGTTADIVIPNSFFLTNPEGMAFTPTPDDSLVSLHLSQSFSYSVVGGSANFPAPLELGDAVIGAAAPEPSSMGLFGIGICLCAGVARKFRRV
jgi:hypothetical protein